MSVHLMGYIINIKTGSEERNVRFLKCGSESFLLDCWKGLSLQRNRTSFFLITLSESVPPAEVRPIKGGGVSY